MTRQQSQMMKGVAILLMIFLHLFNQEGNVALCHNLLFIDGIPLVSILSRAANPVAFFLILGGYGLYRVYEKGDRHRWSRLAKLMIHYWIILLIFVTIGHFIHPTAYPGSFFKILSNITGYQTTYNGEMWFLLPYVILSACSKPLFDFLRRFRAWIVVCVTLVIYLGTSFCISRYGASFLYSNYWVYDPLLVLHLLFNFCLGAMAARSNFFERLKAFAANMRHISILASEGVIILVSVSCVFKYNFFYAFGIITCLILIKMPGWLKTTLAKLGDQSMNMWMIHSWFCYYLFHDFIYSFEYPLVIFVVLTAISYACSLIVNKIALPVERLFMPKREVLEKPIL